LLSKGDAANPTRDKTSLTRHGDAELAERESLRTGATEIGRLAEHGVQKSGAISSIASAPDHPVTAFDAAA
jgi:hypothetical protein